MYNNRIKKCGLLLAAFLSISGAALANTADFSGARIVNNRENDASGPLNADGLFGGTTTLTWVGAGGDAGGLHIDTAGMVTTLTGKIDITVTATSTGATYASGVKV
ncbi:MAG: hypothetical protein LBM92_05445, partial [Opitutaceae bacterium]|nr:hypothetical protein [Opitutaceae bacterium]